jgi:hypothetical protein
MAVAAPPPRSEEPTDAVPNRSLRKRLERRTQPAGHALVVMVIALVLATVLNAKGMHKTAAEQTQGPRRDVALALTGALSAVTGFFQIDEPRKVLQAGLGRAGDDDVNEKIAFTHRPRPGVPTTKGTPPRPVRKPVFTAARPMRLYIAGDSLIGGPGQVVENEGSDRPNVKLVGPGLDYRVSTGLAQPGVFNWFSYLPSKVSQLKPNVVVMSFGGNDGQSLFGTGGGEQYGTPEWMAEYRRRVAGLMDEVLARKARIVWVGLPIPRDPSLAAKFRVMNGIFSSEAAKRPGLVAYVDNYKRFEAPNGGYADYLRDAGGTFVKVRASDGVHYDIGGAQIVSDEIFKAMGRVVDLR